ncbi:MAG: META domain-containing protein [Chloroflexota bacterium]
MPWPRPSRRATPVRALLVAVAALTIAGPASVTTAAEPSAAPDAPDAPAAGLEGVDWRLQELAGSGIPVIAVPPSVEATLRIDNARAGGSGGCNTWGADVTIDGAAITFGPITSTLVLCAEPAASMETAYLGYLPQVRAWVATPGRLELRDADGVTLLAFAGPGGASIIGPDWHATSLPGVAGADPVPADIDITLQVDPDEQASGTAACNRYAGSATIDGPRLTFSPMAVTEMACPEPRMTLEAAWLQVLAATAGWRLDAGRLQLVDAGGSVLATLTAGADASITGRWTLVELGDPASGTVSRLTTDAFLAIADDGTITGGTGCSPFVARATIAGDAITVGPVGTEGLPCPDGATIAVEQGMLDALAGTARWRIDTVGWLELLDHDGGLLAAFERMAPTGG